MGLIVQVKIEQEPKYGGYKVEFFSGNSDDPGLSEV